MHIVGCLLKEHFLAVPAVKERLSRLTLAFCVWHLDLGWQVDLAHHFFAVNGCQEPQTLSIFDFFDSRIFLDEPWVKLLRFDEVCEEGCESFKRQFFEPAVPTHLWVQYYLIVEVAIGFWGNFGVHNLQVLEQFWNFLCFRVDECVLGNLVVMFLLRDVED